MEGNKVPAEDLNKKKTDTKLLSEQLDKLIEDREEENDIKPEDYYKLSKDHFRSNKKARGYRPEYFAPADF